jgi:hypothetical protein
MTFIASWVKETDVNVLYTRTTIVVIMFFPLKSIGIISLYDIFIVQLMIIFDIQQNSEFFDLFRNN